MMATKRTKTTTTTTTGAPPRRSLRIQKQFLWDCLRNTNDIMGHVYSFLSVYDLVHLAEVDKTFRDDEARGRVVGIYGHKGLDLLEAFETIKKWHDYEMSPRYQMDEMSMLYRGDQIVIKVEWYTPMRGWDLERIRHEYFGFRRPDEIEEALQFYSGMNEDRVHMKRMEKEIRRTYQMRPDLAPYNTLFYLLRKYGLGRLADQFLTAQRPELDGDDENIIVNDENVMELDEYDANGEYNYYTYMPHLRPGRALLMSPSMHEKKKSTKTTTTTGDPPRRSLRILEKQFMWDCLRNTNDIMGHVYSFLSVYDRVHLAEVDKTFRDDEARGRVVGIYGDEGLDLLKAFETIKKWHDYEMSPWYCVERGVEFEIEEEWYTPMRGWDLERIMNESDFGHSEELDAALQFYVGMNVDRVHMNRIGREIRRTYQMRPDLAPYNILFDLLKKHSLWRLAYKFINAREPDLYGDDDDKRVMMYDEFDENGDYIDSTAMSHLRPGRQFLAFPGCKPLILKQCGDCKKFKEGIKTECCSWDYCSGFDTCRACTRYRTCASCGCDVKCRAEDCPNESCNINSQVCPFYRFQGQTCCFGLELYTDDDDSISTDEAEEMEG